MIPDKTLKLRHMPELTIGASVDVFRGRPIVTIRLGDLDCQAMTASESRRVAASLIRAADCCDAKTRASKDQCVSALTREIKG